VDRVSYIVGRTDQGTTNGVQKSMPVDRLSNATLFNCYFDYDLMGIQPLLICKYARTVATSKVMSGNNKKCRPPRPTGVEGIVSYFMTLPMQKKHLFLQHPNSKLIGFHSITKTREMLSSDDNIECHPI
jgi:hypothetical protein